jgi:capsular exopolysaccharide synthesis family protein
LLVTSTGTGEGKSFVTANLATIIAQTRRRVVAVDGDPWKPGLHEIFDLPNNVGLSSVLSETTPLAEAVQESGLPGVHVLTAGPPLPSTPDELPQALQMARPLEQLARDYDVVLLDTPAFQNVADAAMIAPQLDGVLLVVGLGQAKREAVQATRQELARVRARVFGVVVNRCDPEAHAKYYKDAKRATMEEAAMAAVSAGGPARILVVEDDPSLARLMNTRLSRAGYEIQVTDNGQTALQMARRWKPDLVILDVVLSDNVDGFEVSQEIRRTRKLATVPIIMVTARVDYDAKVAGIGGGADDYITKPFDVDDLALRVAALLRRAQVGSEGQWPTLADPSISVAGDSNDGSEPAQATDGGHQEGNPH